MYQDSLENVESPEELEESARQFVKQLDIEHLVDRLTGRDGGLRPSKPQAQSDTNFEAYIWRMARFHSGDDPSMPVTAQMDLRIWLENESGIDISGIDRESLIGDGRQIDTSAKGYKQIVAIADFVSRVCVAALNGNPNGGLKRWEKALYG